MIQKSNQNVLHLDTETFEIYVSAADEDSDADQPNGEVISIELAMRLWDSGVVEDYNMAFWRIATGGFSLASVRAYYANSDLVVS